MSLLFTTFRDLLNAYSARNQAIEGSAQTSKHDGSTDITPEDAVVYSQGKELEKVEDEPDTELHSLQNDCAEVAEQLQKARSHYQTTGLHPDWTSSTLPSARLSEKAQSCKDAFAASVKSNLSDEQKKSGIKKIDTLTNAISDLEVYLKENKTLTPGSSITFHGTSKPNISEYGGPSRGVSLIEGINSTNVTNGSSNTSNDWGTINISKQNNVFHAHMKQRSSGGYGGAMFFGPSGLPLETTSSSFDKGGFVKHLKNAEQATERVLGISSDEAK